MSKRPEHAFHPLRVAAVRRLCEDAVAVSFDVPPALGDRFAFRPGQCLTLRRVTGGAEERRSYSICAPAGSRPRIAVREIPGGRFSSWLVRQVRPGDMIEALPPSGSFTPDLRHPAHHVLIAAGSGITPLLSIAASVLTETAGRVSMLYGNRSGATVMFADELADLKDAYPTRFDLTHVLSREPREAERLSGRLDANRLASLLPMLYPVGQVDHWWLCGPAGMVADARRVLDRLGVRRGLVHQELFGGTATRRPSEPPPVTTTDLTSEVTVVLDGRATTTTQPRDVTILDAARRARPDVPFACRAGVCGTCRARVTTGLADMRDNFALEDAELDAGFILTCQSVPTSEKVTVEFDG